MIGLSTGVHEERENAPVAPGPPPQHVDPYVWSGPVTSIMEDIMGAVKFDHEGVKGQHEYSPKGKVWVARYTSGARAMTAYSKKELAHKIATELGWLEGTTSGVVEKGGTERNEVCKKYFFFIL